MASPRQNWLIGVDVGGTKVAAGAVDPHDGAVTLRREQPTLPERGPRGVVADIVSLVETIAETLRNEGGEPGAIGIGVPELVDAEGRIRSSHLLAWDLVPVHERVAAFAPTRIESDVRAAALAEATFGAGRDFELFAYVSIGTGISSAVVQDGVPLVGARGGALVLSSGTLGVPCPECSNWTEFVLETYASGPALARRYAEATGQPVADAHVVAAAANEGEPEAARIVDSAADALGSALGWLVNVIDPEAIVVGGGLGLAPGRYRDRLVKATRVHIWNPGARELPFVSASLGGDSGLIGAALSAYRRVAKHDHHLERSLATMIGERR
jgi:predicted NBD/HSP70 family sugar kinase